MKNIVRPLLLLFMIMNAGMLKAQDNSYESFLRHKWNIKHKDEFPDGDFTYKFVKPPIRGVNVERKQYSVDASGGGIIEYPSGTKIYVHKNSFVDASGKKVAGNVMISYREFRDPVDILVSGIPMVYDSGRARNLLESAGMFEINAYANGVPVYLADNKRINLDFASTDGSSAYNFYFLNPRTQNWDYLGKADGSAVSGPSGDMPIVYDNTYTRAVREYRSQLRSRWLMGYDSTDFASRYEDPEFFYTQKKKYRQQKSFIWGKSMKREAKLYSLIKLRPVKTQKDGRLIFKITYYADNHPELNAFNTMAWVTDGKMKSSDFRKNYGVKNYYSDIRITESGSSYTIELKGRNGFHQLSASPVFVNSDNKVLNTDEQAVEKKYKRYQKFLAWREKRFNRALKKGNIANNNYTLSSEQKPFYAWKEAKCYMNNEEKVMTFEQWKEYYDNLVAQEKNIVASSQANASNLIRSLSIDGFGIFNCDQIARLNSPVTVKAAYRDENGKQLSVNLTYIIDKNINSVLSYGGWEGSKNNISFSPSSNNVMISVKGDNSIAIFSEDEFKKNKYTEGGSYTFGMKEVDAKITSVGELRKLAGL